MVAEVNASPQFYCTYRRALDGATPGWRLSHRHPSAARSSRNDKNRVGAAVIVLPKTRIPFREKRLRLSVTKALRSLRLVGGGVSMVLVRLILPLRRD